MIRIGIVGYGNIGRGVELAIALQINSDERGDLTMANNL